MDATKEIKRLKTKRNIILVITIAFVIFKVLDGIFTRESQSILYNLFAVIVIVCNFINIKFVNKRIAELESK